MSPPVTCARACERWGDYITARGGIYNVSYNLQIRAEVKLTASVAFEIFHVVKSHRSASSVYGDEKEKVTRSTHHRDACDCKH